MAKKEYYIDPMGDRVPTRHVSVYERKRDRTALLIAKRWLDMERKIRELKQDTIDRILELQAASSEAPGVKTIGGVEGNMQFRSFDGNITVSLGKSKRTEFDERLGKAQSLIMEAVRELTANVNNADLLEIATKAFQPRRGGNLDMQRIRDLVKMNVKHPKWREACDIIGQCERVIGSRRYVRVFIRKDQDHKPEPIILDIAAL